MVVKPPKPPVPLKVSGIIFAQVPLKVVLDCLRVLDSSWPPPRSGSERKVKEERTEMEVEVGQEGEAGAVQGG